MEIKKIKINGYGKLKNKEINFKKNINIIYGKNESGKSTLQKFILNSFYGTSKNKKGKEISDFEKYLPWDTEDFSGKINYSLDNGQEFEIFREFKKKNPKIYNEFSEEITKNYNINKSTGSEFFYEQTKMDEETFLSTAIIQQQEVKINKNIQNVLIQKISNLVNTGKDNNSYNKIIEKINKKQLEEIGTERSREKPINIVKLKLDEINDKLNELKQFRYEESEIDSKINTKEIEIQEQNNQIELLQNINILNQEKNIYEEKIKINEKIENGYQDKINALQKEIEEINNKEKNLKNNKENNKNINLLIILIIILIINTIQYIFIKNNILKNIFLLTVPIYLIFCIIKINKLNKKNNKKNNLLNNQIKEIEKEINVLQKNKNETKQEIERIKEENNYKIKIEKEKIKDKYKASEEEINDKLLIQNLIGKINLLQQEKNKNEIEIANFKIRKNMIEEEKDKIEKLEEEKNILTEKYQELCKKNESMNIAKEAINKAYEIMKKNVSPKFLKNLSNAVSNITNNEHSNIKLSDEEGLVIELKNGNYINVNRLSIGTIDQLYLSFRFAIIEEICEEKIPIILDEAFAYYDDERLNNILLYLNKNYSNRQIIIFTCTNREKEILEKNNIQFNYYILD